MLLSKTSYCCDDVTLGKIQTLCDELCYKSPSNVFLGCNLLPDSCFCSLFKRHLVEDDDDIDKDLTNTRTKVMSMFIEIW